MLIFISMSIIYAFSWLKLQKLITNFKGSKSSKAPMKLLSRLIAVQVLIYMALVIILIYAAYVSYFQSYQLPDFVAQVLIKICFGAFKAAMFVHLVYVRKRLQITL